MRLVENQLYHFYNQGNNQQPIFFNRENYLFFLQKVRKHILPHCKVLCYCLMPNHFHFMIYTTADSVKAREVGTLSLTALSNGFRQFQSSYTQAINKQEGRSGSLFRQKTKYKILEHSDAHHPFICFNYIHQNPLSAQLVNRMEDWEFSSFRDYISLRTGSLCDQQLATELLDLDKNKLYDESYKVIEPRKLKYLF